MGKYNFTEPHKQHISLSAYAWDVIDHDLMCFSGDGADMPLAKLLNRIFLNFYERAQASIPRRLDERKEEIEYVLKDLAPDVRAEVTKKLLSAYKDELTAKINMPADNRFSRSGRSFTVQKRVYELLTSLREEGYFINENGSKITSGKYMSATFEEYTRLPYYGREQVYFHESVIAINRAIELGRAVTVTYASSAKQLIRCWALPYSVQTDSLSMYNYFIGYSRLINKTDSQLKQIGIRLSNILNVEIDMYGKSGNGTLNDAMREDIKNSLSKHDAMFMTDSSRSVRIMVRLTNIGQRNYNKHLHMRPRFVSKQDGFYVFDCTMRQAEYYFIKFGKEAEILSPSVLRKKFDSFYTDAAIIYK